MPKQKSRPKKTILADLRRVRLALEPENLTCDGELSRTEVKRRFKSLQLQDKTLCDELGYCPSDDDLFGSLFGDE